jgi:hypothetical protein
VLPLLPSLVKRYVILVVEINSRGIFDISVNETIASDVLNSLLSSPSVMNSAIECTTHLLLGSLLRSKGELNSVALQLLTVIYQRHGPIFSEGSAKILAAIVDEDDRQTFERILRFVALVSQRFFYSHTAFNIYVCSRRQAPGTMESGYFPVMQRTSLAALLLYEKS